MCVGVFVCVCAGVVVNVCEYVCRCGCVCAGMVVNVCEGVCGIVKFILYIDYFIKIGILSTP